MERNITVTVIKAECEAQKTAKDTGKLKRKISQVSDLLSISRKTSKDNGPPVEKEVPPTTENILTSDLIIHPPSFGKFTAELQLKRLIGKEKKLVVVKVYDAKLEILFEKENASNNMWNEEKKDAPPENIKSRERGLKANILQKLKRLSREEKENGMEQKQNNFIDEKDFIVHGYIPLPSYILSETLEFSMNFFGNLHIEASIKGAITAVRQFRRKTIVLDNGPLHERIARQVSEVARNSPLLKHIKKGLNAREGGTKISTPANAPRRPLFNRQVSTPASFTHEKLCGNRAERRMTLDNLDKSMTKNQSQEDNLIASGNAIEKRITNNIKQEERQFFSKIRKILKNEPKIDGSAKSPGTKCRDLVSQVLVNPSPAPTKARQELKRMVSTPSYSPLHKQIMLKNLSSQISPTKSNKKVKSTSNITADYKLFVSSEIVAHSPLLSTRMSRGATPCKGVFQPLRSPQKKGSKVIKSCTWELKTSEFDSAVQATSLDKVEMEGERNMILYRQSKSMD